MRLTYIMNMRMPTEKAHGVQVTKMCEAFATEGANVTLLVSNRRTPIEANPYSYYGVQQIFNIRRLFSLDFVRYGAWGFHVQSITFLVSVFAYLLVSRPHMVYTRDPWVAFLARICLLSHIGWEVHTARAAWLCRLGGRSASKIVVISRGLKEHLVQAGVPISKIVVEHDGADLDEFSRLPSREIVRTSLKLPLNGQIIGYIGKLTTMGERKGVEEIITTAGALKREFPTLFLLLVGVNEDELKPTRDLVLATGLSEDSFRLVPHVSRTEIPLYLRACTVLVMNYPNTPHYARMMSPLKLFEYMASKTPVVTSDLPSIREVLDEESAYFVAPDDPTDLCRGVREALQEPEAASAKAGRAAEIVAAYSWNARAARILRLL